MPKLVAARPLARQCLIFVRSERCSMVTAALHKGAHAERVLMTLHVALTHRTAYHYDRVIGLAPQVIRLRPAPHCRTPILGYSLQPRAQGALPQLAAGPVRQLLRPRRGAGEDRPFVVTVDLVADMAVINPFDFFVEDSAKDWPFAYDPDLKAELKPYLEPLPARPLLKKFLVSIPAGRKARSTSSPTSTAGCAARSTTACAWSRACRRRTRR